MAVRQREGSLHFFAVTQHNLAALCIVEDDAASALEAIEQSISVLEGGTTPFELQASFVIRALAHSMLGSVDLASASISRQLRDRESPIPDEVHIELADLLDSYVDPDRAGPVLSQALGRDDLTLEEQRSRSLTHARWNGRRGRHAAAKEALADYPVGRPTTPGIEASRLLTVAYLATKAGDANSRALAEAAERHAMRQGAHRWRRYAALLRAANEGGDRLSDAIWMIGEQSPHAITYVADVIAPRLHELDAASVATVRNCATTYPARWRSALREVVAVQSAAQLAAAELLEDVGERADIRPLRDLARKSKRRPGAAGLGRRLARRLADRVVVEDQGRVSIRIGDRVVAGSEIRRKVLATICFLVSRPGMSATRDQVLDTLWPDLDPDTAGNSLNQTVYFLRRVIEPDYVEDLSPGYLHHDTDVLWLDADLIRSSSATTRDLIRSMPAQPSPDEVERLVVAYTGRFALDFEYEEWAAAYRDSLHAAYLEIVERAVSDDFHSGHYDRGISVARRVLEVDPKAENVEMCLLRLYKATGAHAAAAEQYAHYAAAMRTELGVDPPPLDSL
jgi:DNA-binding SARP family transcriptional activator